VCLIDKEGKIVFVGHPASRDLEKDIDALLKGEVLVGNGTTVPKKEEEEKGDDKEISAAEFKAATEHFMNGCEKLDVKADAAKLQRAFFVLDIDQTVDKKTGKLAGDIICIT